MVLRIEQIPNDSETIFMLIGRISSPEVQELKAKIALEEKPVALDLEQVRLVNLDAVHFLATAEKKGIELRNVPHYVRAWILLEQERS
jgi:anti-anti-sigma regulatory factor